MTVLEHDRLAFAETAPSGGEGPVTRGRLRRTFGLYAVACVLGYMPTLTGMSPALQAAGLGLWFPGAGFLASSGWSLPLLPVALACFAVAVFAWFGAGLVLAPFIVWLAFAALAGALAGDAVWSPAAALVPLSTFAFFGVLAFRDARKGKADRAHLQMRQAFLPQALSEAARTAAPVPQPGARELSPEQLAALRYALDRALQPVGQYGGYNRIDQFQTASLRYQINTLSYTLALIQTHYAPSFHGYLSDAQVKLTETYLAKQVWGYWVYETAWGHLNLTNFDPAGRDNIMLTGWLGLQLGLHMSASGDFRYAEPGSLPFRLNAGKTFEHSIHTLAESVVANYERADFCIYPCEPNWLYPICNHYGMTFLAIYDRLFGTDHAQRIMPSWVESLDTEFTDRKGSIIGLRSELTGIEFPFPTGEIAYAGFENAFLPDRARRLWAVARTELRMALQSGADGRNRILMPGKGFDFGNYKPGWLGAYASIMSAAREFGDEELAAAAELSAAEACGKRIEDGVLRYEGGSNLTNLAMLQASVRGRDDYRNAIVAGPPKACLSGPVLARATYPDVLVARAWSDGEGLELVLHPGRGTGTFEIGLDRLQPGAAYVVSGAGQDRLVADAAGRAAIRVVLDGRTEVRLSRLAV